MNIKKIQMQYYAGGKLYGINSSSFENAKDFNVSLTFSDINEKNGTVFSIKLLSMCDIIVDSFSVELELETPYSKMLVNGFQSWSESKEKQASDRQPKLSGLLRPLLSPYGDYFFCRYSGKKGLMHSHTYTLLYNDSSSSSNCFFIGSVDEISGYTVFEADMNRGTITVFKDCKGLGVSREAEILKLFSASGEEKTLWQKYLSYFPSIRKPAEQCTGWTSWYNYYTSITEDIVLSNLSSLRDNRIPIKVFQIDDGYQNAIGDWLRINSKFPSGMKHIADEIRKCGYKPGLWLAPFICEKKSELYKTHPEWVLRNEKGKPVAAGWNPNWSGTFYAMDIYNTGFRDYLKEVFDTVLNEWGFEMVKLDFLYGAALLPRNGKTRAAVMSEAMELLSNLTGDRWLLGCGVPLAPAFGKVDYCRIGADVAPYWEDKKLKALNYRERVSTICSLHSTLARFRLNSKVFLNDPDVFIIREENNKLDEYQKYTLFLLNNLLGDLVFMSDNIANYGDKEMQLFKSMFPKISPNINYITKDSDTYTISFNTGEQKYFVLSNLTAETRQLRLPEGIYFNSREKLIQGNTPIQLLPYESKCYYKVEKNSFYPVIGTTGYVFPGSEIESVILKGDNLDINFKKDFINNDLIYFDKSSPYRYASINGKRYDIIETDGYKFIEYRL